MGTDINGWLEVFPFERWEGVANLSWFLERDYSLFALLFGARGGGEVLPLASGRGFPPDPSHELRFEIDEGGYDDQTYASWVLWSEVQPLVRNGSYLKYETEMHLKTASGLRFMGTKAESTLLTTAERHDLYRRGELEKGRYIYKVRTKEVELKLLDGWRRLFDLCASIEADRQPADGIRIAAYFG